MNTPLPNHYFLTTHNTGDYDPMGLLDGKASGQLSTSLGASTAGTESLSRTLWTEDRKLRDDAKPQFTGDPLCPSNTDTQPDHQRDKQPAHGGKCASQLSRFEENLAWLLIGGGLDYLLDDEDLSLIDLVAQITPKTEQSVEWYVGRRINKALSPWIDSPLEFRELLRSTRSIISGSLALQVALAASWSCDGMDIYIPEGEARDTVIRYLCQEEWYTVVQPGGANTSGRRPRGEYITSTTLLERKIRTLQGETIRKINIIQSSDDATKPVSSFSTTWCMNWIASDEIIVLYPEMTLAYEGVLNSPQEVETDEQAIWLSKYISRGFKLVDGADIRTSAPWPCTSICSIRRAMDEGQDASGVVSSTYRRNHSPEETWVQRGWRSLSDLEYTCVDHNEPPQAPPNYVARYNYYHARYRSEETDDYYIALPWW